MLQINENTRYCTFLDMSGDTTLAWDETADEKMLDLIKRKMEEGVTFWLIELRLGGILPPKKTKLTDINKIGDKRAVSLLDEDFIKVLDTGHAELTTVDSNEETKVVRKAKSAEEVASGKSVATRPLKGG